MTPDSHHGSVPPLQRVTSHIALGAAAAIPLVYLPFITSPFETPKTALLRAAAIALAAVFLIRVVLAGRTALPAIPRLHGVLSIAIVAWSAVTMLVSVNRPLSAYGLLYVAAAAVLFVGMSEAVNAMSLRYALGVLLIPAIVSAGVLVLQWSRVWTVIPENPHEPRLRLGGMLGNPDYVAAYLLAPAIVAIVLTIVSARKALYGAASLALVGGLALSQSFTALASIGAAMLMIGLLSNWRRMLVIFVLGATLGAGLVYGPWRGRAANLAHAWAERDYDGLTAGRAAAFLTAWEMFKDHPLTGAGVSTYSFEFMRYRLIADEKYPSLQFASRGTNFAEAHNDHLEILAETGLPGYALFWAVLSSTAAISLRARRGEREQNLRRLLALPLASAFAVLALAQFPISLPGVVMPWLLAVAIVHRKEAGA